MMIATYARRTLLTLVVTAIVMAASTPAAAQEARPDSRWQAWLGCWTPSGAGSATIVTPDDVCVWATDNPNAVDMVTTANGDTTRQRFVVDGQRHPIDESGCAGWEQADWSSDRRRLYLQSELTCAGGEPRRSTGLFGITAGGEWMDIMSVRVGGNTGVRVAQYRPSVMAPPSMRSRASAAARAIAGGAIDAADVLDVVAHVDEGVAQAWFLQAERPLRLSADRLVELADAGVPDGVIDVMVAVAYPNAFALRATQGPTATPADDAMAIARTRETPRVDASRGDVWGPFGLGYRYGAYPFESDFWGPDRHGYRYNEYLRYLWFSGNGDHLGFYSPDRLYYSPYSYWYAGVPVAIEPVGSGGGSPAPASGSRGRVVAGSGYSQGAGSSSAVGQPAASSTTSSDSSSSSSSPSTGTPAAYPSSEQRTAQPR